jgi:hypothetical protein
LGPMPCHPREVEEEEIEKGMSEEEVEKEE